MYTGGSTVTNVSGISSATTRPWTPVADTAIAGDASASITWKDPAIVGNATILDYTVTISPAPTSGSASQTVTVKSATFNNLANGTTYNFSITARNSAGSGNALTVSLTLPPTKPIITVASELLGTTMRVSVTVTNSATNGATSYKLFQRTSEGGALAEYTGPFVTNGATTGAFVFDIPPLGGPATYSYAVTGYTAAGTVASTQSDEKTVNIPCLPRGTRILTPSGYRLVEDLRSGDEILTDDGRAVPIVRVHRSGTVSSNAKSTPVRIAARSFFGEYPVAPLRVSSWHAFKVGPGNQWILPKDVLGVAGVEQEAFGQVVDYYHFEMPDFLRDNLVIEGGAVVESYGIPWLTANNVLTEPVYVMDPVAGYAVRRSAPSLPRPLE